ncbi:maleylacetate reductase [Amycolatopsis sp. MtRt-6]|uniref:maleylacetate reductase n=1 Tax=Amycolatopsis sp. MtRt-6 TaxID=2792782 RepID=UPI001A905AB9|nr:maleylacetate reductase [Amycolatopsis sp. MtRt-6]
MRFVHDTLPQRIRFASGEAAAHLAAETTARGCSRVMVIAAESEKDTARRVAGSLPVAVWHHEVAPHVPVEVAHRARAAAAAHDVDALVSVGGGSTTGLAKAVALTTGLPIIAVPTTYAGSEATDVWGLTDANRKTTGTDARVLPRTVVYDASLTLTLPVRLSVASGLNALAHCVDALWAPRANPVNAALAGEGIRALNAGLPRVADDPGGLPGREQALYGAYLSAVAFASAGSGLHHKICHVLGGMFDLPHAATHAVVLPHVLALNESAAPEAERRIAAALHAPSAVTGLSKLRARLAAPVALRDHGMPEAGIGPAAEAVLSVVPPGNPAPVDIESLTALVRAAWAGTEEIPYPHR